MLPAGRAKQTLSACGGSTALAGLRRQAHLTGAAGGRRRWQQSAVEAVCRNHGCACCVDVASQHRVARLAHHGRHLLVSVPSHESLREVTILAVF
eukprot:6639641-Prymnesium_polylepis.2